MHHRVRQQQGVPHHADAGRGEGLHRHHHPEQHLCHRPDAQPGRPHPPLHDHRQAAHLHPPHPGGGGHQGDGSGALPVFSGAGRRREIHRGGLPPESAQPAQEAADPGGPQREGPGGGGHRGGRGTGDHRPPPHRRH